MTVFGPSDAAGILREATRPFQDNGFLGVTTTNSRRRGGSDHTSFNEVGLPGLACSRTDRIRSHTWHTNLDTYERVIEDDARQSAMVIAAAVYHLAMRDDLLPRLDKAQMPALLRLSPNRRERPAGDP
jgi:Zn-dependent M28 family amino/carboxypeptidase